jgi:hypothetical protein
LHVTPEACGSPSPNLDFRLLVRGAADTLTALLRRCRMQSCREVSATQEGLDGVDAPDGNNLPE